MAGTTWPTFVAGARAKASELDSRFEWIENDIVPMIDGTRMDNTYDLGQSSFRWRDVYSARQFLGGYGSIGTPTYSFQGRSTDGFYSPTTNQVGLSLNGVQWINYRDNAGILEVDGGQSWSRGIDTSDNNSYKLSVGDNLSTNTVIKVYTNGTISLSRQIRFNASRSTTFQMSATSYVASMSSTIDTQNCLDATTGYFVTPIAGLYLFGINVGYQISSSTTLTVLNFGVVKVNDENEIQPMYYFDGLTGDPYPYYGSYQNFSGVQVAYLEANITIGSVARANGGFASCDYFRFYGCLLQ